MISPIFEKELKNHGYVGQMDVASLMMSLPTTATVFLKDDGGYGSVTPAVGIGIMEGFNSPEDALAANWLELKNKGYQLEAKKNEAKIRRASNRKRRY